MVHIRSLQAHRMLFRVLGWILLVSLTAQVGLSQRFNYLERIAWSPDGTRIAIADGSLGCDPEKRDEYALDILDVETSTFVFRLQGPICRLVDISWSPDGAKIASSSFNGGIFIWNAVTGELLFTPHLGVEIGVGLFWSPDSTRIASIGSGGKSAFVWDAATGQRLFTLPEHEDFTTSVAWSPDGSRMATSALDGTVKVWNMATQQEVMTLQQTASVHWVAWSADGSRLATASRDGTVETWDALSGQSLAVFNGHTASVEIVVWSPDSSQLASGSVDETVRIWDVATGQRIDMIQSIVGPIVDVAWSPTGDSIAYIGANSGNEGGLPVIVPAPGGTSARPIPTQSPNRHTPIITAMSTAVMVTSVPLQDTWEVRASPLASSSDKLVFAMPPGYPEDTTPNEIFTMDTDGSHLVQLTFNNSSDYSPVWSPDGSKIAFISDRDGNSEIYVMNADGSNQIRLTNNTFADLDAAWVGNKIVFMSNRDGDPEIFVMNADGTNPVNLTNNTSRDLHPVWSPNGDRIAFTSNRDGIFDVYVMNADGSNPTRLTFAPNADSDFNFPAWSPDGTMLAFRGGTMLDLYRVNVDGTNFAQITFGEAGVFDFAWLPNSSQIAFSSGSSMFKGVYIINLDGTNRTLLELDWPPEVASFSAPVGWTPVATPPHPHTPIIPVVSMASARDNSNE